jgi:ribosomal protein L33
MAKAEARGYVSLECTVTGVRLYRVQKKLKGNPYKLELMKYNPKLRMRTLHKETKK